MYINVKLLCSTPETNIIFYVKCISRKKRKIIRRGPNPIGLCPYKKRKFGDTCTSGECHVNRKTEIGVIHLQAKEHQRLPAEHQKPEKRPGTDSPSQP